jgi:spore germination protein GerM
MTAKRTAWIAVFLVAAAGIVCTIVFLKPRGSEMLSIAEERPLTRATDQPGKTDVHLYFTDKENRFLIGEKRVLFPSDDPAGFGRQIIDALIKGPREGLMRSIPSGTAVRAIYVTGDGTSYVDFSETIRDNHPGGTQTELMTIFAIVNSLVLNVPEIDAVKILVGGREITTLAGHIDLRFPFKANMLLVR